MIGLRSLFLGLFLVFTSMSLMAQEEKKITIENAPAAIPPETVHESAPSTIDKADQLITNRRLRADSGSLSLWSVSSGFTYQGGSVAHPKDASRPNIVKGADAITLQNFTGDIGVRYRLTKLLSITGSTGVFMTTPFHDSIKTNNKKLRNNFDENHQKMTVNDPFLKTTYVNKFHFLQSVTQAKVTLITNNQQKLDGYRWNYYASQQFMHNVDDTKFSYGVNMAISFYSFGGKENLTLTDQVHGIYPAVEYEISEKVNFRTTFGTWVYQHIRNDNHWTYQKRTAYQSVGLGILLSRDVFLYPNIQYIPSDIRADRTNIALTANINFF
jgi:hypothetical protein